MQLIDQYVFSQSPQENIDPRVYSILI